MCDFAGRDKKRIGNEESVKRAAPFYRDRQFGITERHDRFRSTISFRLTMCDTRERVDLPLPKNAKIVGARSRQTYPVPYVGEEHDIVSFTIVGGAYVRSISDFMLL